MVVADQPIHPELLEDARHHPLLEAPVCGGMVADAGGIQGTPLAAGARHKEDRVHGSTVIHPRVVAAQGVRLPWRKEGLHLLPQRIRDAPAIVFNYKAHEKSSPFIQKTSASSPTLQALLR